MPFISAAIGLAGLALAGAGLYENVSGQASAASANQQALQIQEQEAQQQEQEMNLDAARRRREMVRQSVAASSTALAVSTNQGAQLGSGLPGAYGGISGQTNTNMVGVNQNQEIAGNIFALKGQENTINQSIAGYKAQSAIGAGISSLGGALVSNMGTFDKIGAYFGYGSRPTANGAAGEGSGDSYG